ncbi:hypothetical protein BO82DRAFT_170344 [Aspergillus uvarum CBS 121591]|uniref:Core domain-containing protein n=1 Tax=Aspergillus uvarum CBS 121591 TaxID=1448315 RepID=A0A319C0Z1_9EURO|nr:hypothetical protein BO82DRAFT_170344 [Aspergillus uvarum CBS 121591]PYH77867.1 hypothetical protein BO82DRAFT_170344 [Aspergillus uvarum CBS 121591]
MAVAAGGITWYHRKKYHDQLSVQHIRPQGVENRASRPLSRTQATRRPVSSWRLREITDPTSSPSATKEENPYDHLRITVTSGGCHGFQYMMSLEAASKIDPEEDTVFEAEDAPAGPGEAKVVMDEPSLELLHGSTVDYTMELIGSQFKIVDNPRASSNCGCGTSFDVLE